MPIERRTNLCIPALRVGQFDQFFEGRNASGMIGTRWALGKGFLDHLQGSQPNFLRLGPPVIAV